VKTHKFYLMFKKKTKYYNPENTWIHSYLRYDRKLKMYVQVETASKNPLIHNWKRDMYLKLKEAIQDNKGFALLNIRCLEDHHSFYDFCKEIILNDNKIMMVEV
jgi:hypothetical protein